MMKVKIGIVDDHLLFSKSLALMLSSFDKYDVVIQAANGRVLQDRLQVLSEPPELMLIDVNMPVMDGIETAKWLSEMYKSMKLVALSVNDTDKAIIEMIKAGCCAYMLKDTHPDELEKALEEIMLKGYYNADASNLNFRRLLDFEKSQAKISDKEKIFLEHASSDLTYKEIANKMCLSERTIDGYRDNLFQKLNVQSRVGMVLEAIRKGIIKL